MLYMSLQDYEENMVAHRDNHRYKSWNLVSVALLLQEKFAKSCIWIVKPSRMHLRTFAVYGNFVNSNDFGVPSHDQNGGAFLYLTQLLQAAMSMMTSSSYHDDIIFPSVGYELVGFSKGCVVLNQFLYELSAAKNNDKLKDFVGKVSSMYWLDGGHSGGSNTWIAHDDVLQALKGMEISIHVRVTPYQVNDAMRKWIGEEKRKFVSKVKKLGISVHDRYHFEHEERSIENHFRVLTVFK